MPVWQPGTQADTRDVPYFVPGTGEQQTDRYGLPVFQPGSGAQGYKYLKGDPGQKGDPGPEGDPGPQGDFGPVGPAGPSGSAAASYEFQSNGAEQVWIINHGLGFHPNVSVFDNDSPPNIVLCSPVHDTINTCHITFGVPTAGHALLS